jgi:hypothetical protein
MKILSNLKLTFIQRHFSSSLLFMWFFCSDFIPYALAYSQLSYIFKLKLSITWSPLCSYFGECGVWVREGLLMMGQ